MTRLRGPYSVAFPVNFTSRGDTTRDAFRKHMDEITRIYGILTGLDADTMDADNVNNSVNEILQKWKPSMSFNDITGSLSTDRISGLQTFLDKKGKLLTDSILEDNGYIRFGAGGVFIQWGNSAVTKDTSGIPILKFGYQYPNKCFAAVLSPSIDWDAGDMREKKITVVLTLVQGSLSRLSVNYHFHFYRGGQDGEELISLDGIEAKTKIHYIAIGV